MFKKVYADFLAAVRAAAPNMSYRDAQKKASEMYSQYKEAQAPAPPKDQKEKASADSVKGVDQANSQMIEGLIRENAVDINRIKTMIEQNNVSNIVVHEAGKDGPNTLVYATGDGVRVPYSGYFKCFIAR